MADQAADPGPGQPQPRDPARARQGGPSRTAIIATGRSDYPNQVNNVLCFPFIFRGALDVGATTINEEMKLACVDALAELARVPPPETVTAAYGVDELRFGPDYLIPKPFDTRLIVELPPAVAKAAMDTGVATRPLPDLAALPPAPVAAGDPLRPDDEADLRGRSAATRSGWSTPTARRSASCARSQVVVEERLAKPILIGRPEVIDARVERWASALRAGQRLRAGQPGQRPALQRLCRLLSRAGRPQGRLAADRARGAAHPAHRDRGRDAGARRGRRDAGRPGRPASRPICATSSTCIGLRPQMQRGLDRACAGARRRRPVHRRHQRQLRARAPR